MCFRQSGVGFLYRLYKGGIECLLPFLYVNLVNICHKAVTTKSPDNSRFIKKKGTFTLERWGYSSNNQGFTSLDWFKTVTKWSDGIM